MTDKLERKDVSLEFIEKVNRFASSRERFSAGELFGEYPNNPPYLLRYALNNLRIDNVICKYGAKRGAFYSKRFDLSQDSPKDSSDNLECLDLKRHVLEVAQKCGMWFSRVDLFSSLPTGSVLKVLASLIEDGVMESHGSGRATQYRVVGDDDKVQENPLYCEIEKLIKEKKVVTIPIIVEELGAQRNLINSILEAMVGQELIYHEGIKKSSRYIWHTVSTKEADEIMANLKEEKKIETRIDELSSFLANGEVAYISIGANRNGEYNAKFFVDGSVIKEEKFESVKDCMRRIMDMTMEASNE